jgi:3-phenylpropionate/cinnamic acid dioxygenase small subunit
MIRSSPAQGVTELRHQPSSLYVNAAFYDWLVDVSADWNAVVRNDAKVDDVMQGEISRLLATESRLLDQQAFAPWLDLFAAECAYWIPAAHPTPDPRTAITQEFHDRRRLMDRIARLGTGFAYSQSPPSRTARLLSGLEIWASTGRDDEWRARGTFLLAESRQGKNRLLAGWNGFVLRKTHDGLRIVVKQINLIDCDSPQGNNSFFL